ncbi:Hypothetical predicted protein [Octopus vulgaris]|uniref:Uncharacterized protein n=1 Tax=Octopus vulgaris TaxID=6645 RepID=A0AA36B9R5_OCTVU|nr:Hypothetical predicted protein [Octopus vulgaris]
MTEEELEKIVENYLALEEEEVKKKPATIKRRIGVPSRLTKEKIEEEKEKVKKMNFATATGATTRKVNTENLQRHKQMVEREGNETLFIAPKQLQEKVERRTIIYKTLKAKEKKYRLCSRIRN